MLQAVVDVSYHLQSIVMILQKSYYQFLLMGVLSTFSKICGEVHRFVYSVAGLSVLSEDIL